MACNRAAKSGFAAEAQRKVRTARKGFVDPILVRTIVGIPATLTQSTATLLPTLTPGYVDSTY